MKIWPVLCCCAALWGCASHPVASTDASGKVTAIPTQMPQRMGDAVISPLKDLNLVQQDIPEVLLLAAHEGPYRPLPPGSDCAWIASQVIALNAALGGDLDAINDGEGPTLLARGGQAASDGSVSMVQRTVESVVPFRSWLRKLSGAERHSKEVAGALNAGRIRRAYLKGVGLQMGCKPPAAPLMAQATSSPSGTSSGSPGGPIAGALATAGGGLSSLLQNGLEWLQP